LDRIECKKVNVSSIVAGKHAENEIRKDFTISERVAIARAMEAEIGNRQGERTDLKGDGELVEKIPQVESGEKTRVIAARKAGFGNETTYRQAAKAVDKGVPELIDAMDGDLIRPATAEVVATQPAKKQKELVKLAKDNRKEYRNEIRQIRRHDPSHAPLSKRRSRQEQWQSKRFKRSQFDKLKASIDELVEYVNTHELQISWHHAEKAIKEASGALSMLLQ